MESLVKSCEGGGGREERQDWMLSPFDFVGASGRLLVRRW